MPTARRRRRGLTREDVELWRHVTRDVRPLAGLVEPLSVDVSDAAEAPGPEGEPTSRPPRRPPFGRLDSPVRPSQLPEIAHGEVAGVDKRTAQRLRRGRLPIEGRIDLHGLTQEEAHRALSSFLAGSQRAGRRCVLVVTGKGLKPDGRTGVLRANVPRWLNTSPNRSRILAFSYATVRDGGEGALYVLLRRK